MDFELNKTQKDIQKAVRDFVKGEFDKDLALELAKNHEFPKKIWQKAGEIGLIGVHFPEEYSMRGSLAAWKIFLLLKSYVEGIQVSEVQLPFPVLLPSSLSIMAVMK